MPRILFTPLASEDLRDIWIYLAEKSGSETANKFLSEVKKECESVANFPEMGRVRHEYLLNFRSFPFSNYIIFYCRLKTESRSCESFTVRGTFRKSSTK